MKSLRSIHEAIYRMHVQFQAMRPAADTKSISAVLLAPAIVVHMCPMLVHDHIHAPLNFKLTRIEFEQYLADKSVPVLGLARMFTHC